MDDSKYSLLGNSGKNKITFNIKRTLESNKPKKKKLKLTINSDGSNTNSGGVNSNSNDEMSATSLVNGNTGNERIQEERYKLPVYACRKRLLKEIKKYETVIVLGETGSGKTTQIPQLLYHSQIGGDGVIGVTQPRRVAAVTVAMRVANEMRTQLGQIVGYTVRFEDVSSNSTKIKFMTDGMLLREAIGDRLLMKYSVVILDEAHERTLSTDVLFGIVKLAQKERREKNMKPLKVIAMSATMDVDRFSVYLDDCPVLYLEGRTFPVTIYHTKIDMTDYQHATLSTIFQLHSSLPSDHDFLVFLTGQEEIESLAYNIRLIAKEAQGPELRICPLYAGLPPARQLNAWKATPKGVRKVVLATNIAETSITIPNIRCVIDCGYVKERTFWSTTGGERLRITRCSSASAGQRAGRAGRQAPGAAYRLYTAADLAARPTHRPPEILRCSLSSTILWMIAIGVEPSTFPLLDPPPQDTVQTALVQLHSLGAIDNKDNPKLTSLGKKMSAFPVDPKYSKIILSANEFQCLDEILSIVAMLSSENIFISSMEKREDVARARIRMAHKDGDHLTMLNVFKAFSQATVKKQWCKENFLNHRSLNYALEVRRQLLDMCERMYLKPVSCGKDTDQVLRCLLTGLSEQTAKSRGSGVYTTHGSAARIHPASVLHSRSPPVVLYTELLTTTSTYMTIVSTIQPEWLDS